MTANGRHAMTGGGVPAVPIPGGRPAPQLEFAVEHAQAVEYAAVPTLRFGLRIDAGKRSIRSLALNIQVRIAATRRSYEAVEKERLLEVFGTPDRWGSTVGSLLWVNTSLNVPPFDGGTLVDLDLPCTYDFEVVSAKYFHAMEGGEVPLELLFGGSVFYIGDGGGLQVAHVPWDREAAFKLPIGVWREAVDRAFPEAAWLRMGRDTFDRLYRYKARRVLATWEDVVDELLPAEES